MPNQLFGPDFIESKRSSGYKSTIYAIAEIVDNSVDAGAKEITILLFEDVFNRGRERAGKSITDIVFIDNGKGMNLEKLNGCLTFASGEGKANNRIGAFGVGLPQASVSVCERVDVYSKINNHWHSVHLDVDEIKAGSTSEFPDAVIKKPNLHSFPLPTDAKTIVHWSKIDKIDVSEDYRNELKSLITEFSHCFSRDKFDLGCASFYEARLTLKRDFTPKWVPTRQTSYKMQPFMDQQIENLEKSGQISKCRFSIWNLPVFLAVKPNSKSTANPHRFLVHARALNSQVIKDNYELPRINNILDKMTEGKFWSNFDLTSSFTQIGLEQNSRHLTAFTYNQRH